MTPRLLTDPPAPGTPEWLGVISASKIPAILGISRWKSQYALWHEMAGTVEPEPMDPERAAWGHIAEHSIAEMWKWQHPGYRLNTKHTLDDGTRTFELAYTDDSLGFPNLATIDRRAIRSNRHPRWIVECKTARDLDDWGKPGEADAVPADYYAQVIWQMGVSGIHQATIGVLAYGSGPEFHDIEWDESMFQMMVDEARQWHNSLKDGTPPPLDDTVSTYDTIRGLHPDIERGTEIQLDRDQAVAYLDAVHAVEEAEAALTLQKSTLASLMGTAHKAMCGGVKIADRRSRSGITPWVHPNKKARL